MKNQNNLEMKNKTNQLNKKSKTMNNQNNLEMKNKTNHLNKKNNTVKQNIEISNEINFQKKDSKIIKQYTIVNMKVDWDLTGVTEDEYNEHHYGLGVGYGWIFKNGTLYHNSYLLGKDDELVQVVFENNNENLTLEDIENKYEPPTPYSGFLYQYWGGLVIDGFEIKPLNEEEVKIIYNNLLTLNDLK